MGAEYRCRLGRVQRLSCRAEINSDLVKTPTYRDPVIAPGEYTLRSERSGSAGREREVGDGE